MKTLAAILVEQGQPLVLDELTIPALKPGQVLVQIDYSGVCHSQINEARGYKGPDRFLPHCLGHEGTGRVLEVGPEATKVKPDDKVILTWLKGTGMDVPGTVYDWNGRSVNAGAVTTFSRHAVVSENRLVKLDETLPDRLAVLLGCAAPTGAGVVLNTARPRPGDSLVVFGAGGIGLCAVAAAKASGCTTIAAVDVKADKLDLAQKMGATHVVNASEGAPLDALAAIEAGGMDFAIEATGRPEVMADALKAVKNGTGLCVVAGNVHHGQQLTIDPWQLILGKSIRGTWGGETQPDRDFPRFARLMNQGLLNLEPLVSEPYPLERINDALDDLEAARIGRPLIQMS